MIDIATRHSRHRRAAVTGAATLSTAAVLLTLAGCAAADPVAAPAAPATSVPATPAAPATSQPAPGGMATDPATGATTGAEPATGGSATAPPVAIDLSTYEFHVEASASADDELSRVDEPTTAWAVDPCRPTVYPTDATRTQFAGAGSSLGDVGRFTQLAQYPDEATAAEVLAGFDRALDSCGQLAEPEPVVGSGVVQWQVFDPAALGDESLTLQSTEYTGDFGLPGIDVVVVRIDTLVLVVGVDNLYAGTSTDPDRVAYVTELATAEVTRLEAVLAGG